MIWQRKNEITVARNHEYKETENINLLHSSYPLCVYFNGVKYRHRYPPRIPCSTWCSQRITNFKKGCDRIALYTVSNS